MLHRGFVNFGPCLYCISSNTAQVLNYTQVNLPIQINKIP